VVNKESQKGMGQGIKTKEHMFIREPSIRLEVVGCTSMVGDCKSVAAMGQAPFVAVLAEGV
jgi:hypothetical protein